MTLDLRDEAEAATHAILEKTGPTGRFFLVVVLRPVNEPLVEVLSTGGRCRVLEQLGIFTQTGLGTSVKVFLCRMAVPETPLRRADGSAAE